MKKVNLCALIVLAASPLTAQTNARGTLLSADARLSDSVYANGAISTFPAALGSDGVLVWPGAGVVQGVGAASEFFRRQPLLQMAKLSWQPFRFEFSPDSSLAVVVGVAVFDRPATDPILPIHRFGRYLAAWKRTAGTWRLSAFALVNTLTPGETIWTSATGPVELPLLRSSGAAGPFVVADSTSAADAARLGIGKALEKWAASDGLTFASTGELNVGPKRIGEVLATNTAHWDWTPVAAGASADGALGWTVGQVIVSPEGGGNAVKTKYLTLWRRMPDGTIRFIARGGSARP